MKTAALFVTSALCLSSLQESIHAFSTTTSPTAVLPRVSQTQSTTRYTRLSTLQNSNDNNDESQSQNESRRSVLQRAISILPVLSYGMVANPTPSFATRAGAEDTSEKYAPKFVQTYEDFTQDPEGWQYKDSKVGTGTVILEQGDRAVFDWSGYTIGYFGRPFEAKGGPQGGAFDKDLDYSRTVIGSNSLVPGMEKALISMKPGGVRQVIVPYGPLSYPADDLEHTRVGPKPSTFSGQRALNFVLENPRVDRTLLFNIKLVRIDKANGQGGFVRG